MTQYACCDKHGLSRRDLLKGVAAGAVTAASPLAATAAKEGKKMTTTETMGQAPVVACKKVAANAPGAKAKVYFSRKIDAQTLIDLYERINEGIYGKVAIKLHTGEKNGPNILPRDMVKAFQATVPDSVIVGSMRAIALQPNSILKRSRSTAGPSVRLTSWMPKAR